MRHCSRAEIELRTALTLRDKTETPLPLSQMEVKLGTCSHLMAAGSGKADKTPFSSEREMAQSRFSEHTTCAHWMNCVALHKLLQPCPLTSPVKCIPMQTKPVRFLTLRKEKRKDKATPVAYRGALGGLVIGADVGNNGEAGGEAKDDDGAEMPSFISCAPGSLCCCRAQSSANIY